MPELGTKHECEECSTRFYDLGSSEIQCPKCGWNPNATEEGESAAPAAPKKAAKKKAAKKKATKKKAAKKKAAK